VEYANSTDYLGRVDLQRRQFIYYRSGGTFVQVKQPPSSTDHCQVSTAASHRLAVERVLHTMRERIREPLSLEDMADIALLSPYHFCRVFHRIVGIPPGEFLAALRLAEAQRLLLTTSLSITDICFELGYASLGSFTTRFTQLVGLPPRHLRNLAEDFTWPSLETLHDYNTSIFCPTPFHRCFLGSVSAPETFAGLIYVGLFPKLIPQGQPVRCTLLSRPGTYFIKSVPDGCYYVLAAALPLSESPLAYLLPDSGLLVGISRGPLVMHNGAMSGQPDIVLRPPQLTDPPIVMALPFL
jgi:AraC family transcriptional regulator